MTPAQHTTLTTLAARFRSRSESAKALAMEYKLAVRAHDAAGSAFSAERDLEYTSYTDMAARSDVWSKAADELEAFLRACEVEVEARG